MSARRLLLVASVAAACASRPPAPTTAPAPAEFAAPDAPAAEPPATVALPPTPEPIVSVAAWFQVGSHDDPPGKEGLSWLTGRMVARAATRHHRYDEILARLYPMAAAYDISVDREMTVLSGRVHRDHARAYLTLFTQAFTAPAFDDADLERLRAEALAHVERRLRYALDEELGKAALFATLFAGTGYAHPPEGTVASLKAITLEDVRRFWREHYTGDRTVFGIAGGWDDELRATLEGARAALPAVAAPAPRPPAPRVDAPQGRRVTLVAKPGADASISFGFPIPVRRGHPDHAALVLATSWLGEHRNLTAHLARVLRVKRGLNYGDYAYVEAFPNGGSHLTPPANVGRSQQAFEVWIRTLPNENAVFAVRAALREVDRLASQGMTRETFELRRSFLDKYVLHFAPSPHERLLWALDDRFYGLAEPYLDRLRRELAGLTLERVNAALKEHLATRRLVIAVATGKPELLRDQLVTGAPTKPTYATPKPKEILDEDEEIARYPLGIRAEDITVVPVTGFMEKGSHTAAGAR